MNQLDFYIEKLTIVFSKATEEIVFNDVTYFFGQMGTGKTSIARIIDYCLGGNINLSPALQSEFVTANLLLRINGILTDIERPRDSDQVIVTWINQSSETFVVQLPARVPSGVVIPETNVEQLSDLIFYLANITAPKVRRSKIKEDSELQRLSFRDLFWYCYIDQDSIDSNFFHLDGDADTFKRLKSRDVMRFILGFHQERVAELEATLQALHIKKLQLREAAASLEKVIKDAGIGSEDEMKSKIDDLEDLLSHNLSQIDNIRNSSQDLPHNTDILRIRGRNLGFEIEALDMAMGDVMKKHEQDTRHKNELQALEIKIRRMAAARAVLGGVDFQSCPRCAQVLPPRGNNDCLVCGQQNPTEGSLHVDPDVLKQDANSRVEELDEIMRLQERQLIIMQKRKDEFVKEKYKVDNELTAQLQSYDSSYLTNALRYEKENSKIEEQIDNLKNLIGLPRKVIELVNLATEAESEEISVRRDLKGARAKAEADLTNLNRLKDLFFDCLIRTQLPGVSDDSEVFINAKDFLPQVINPMVGDLAVTSFSNLSSGGKKTLFKACFAIAVHRLAVEVGALLPTFLLIDSPMKNISERENRVQFEKFHRLVYELASDELRGTQIVLIDKERFNPEDDVYLNMSMRHMTLDNPVYPPLIPYYVE